MPAVLSMWISNTATTLMLLPVALAVLDASDQKERGPDGDEREAIAGQQCDESELSGNVDGELLDCVEDEAAMHIEARASRGRRAIDMFGYETTSAHCHHGGLQGEQGNTDPGQGKGESIARVVDCGHNAD